MVYRVSYNNGSRKFYLNNYNPLNVVDQGVQGRVRL